MFNAAMPHLNKDERNWAATMLLAGASQQEAECIEKGDISMNFLMCITGGTGRQSMLTPPRHLILPLYLEGRVALL